MQILRISGGGDFFTVGSTIQKKLGSVSCSDRQVCDVFASFTSLKGIHGRVINPSSSCSSRRGSTRVYTLVVRKCRRKTKRSCSQSGQSHIVKSLSVLDHLILCKEKKMVKKEKVNEGFLLISQRRERLVMLKVSIPWYFWIYSGGTLSEWPTESVETNRAFRLDEDPSSSNTLMICIYFLE